ncbi:MAG TPA: hypothetical protein VIA62_08040 [Thermoanaerobaculia bacterium]|nr:hypothetical protein [Thermoanaerobaculia bacterium]
MRHRDQLLSLLLLSLALAAGASAQGRAPKAQDKTQPKHEGEARNPYVERFRQLDKNGDGYVSLDEWPLDPASFYLVDRNQDGRLSREELLTPNVLRWDPREEQARTLEASRLRRSESHSGVEPRDRIRSVPLPNYEDTWSFRATPQDKIRFRSLDRNQDNRLDLLEWTGSSLTFNQLDRNRDGVISPSEWP